MGVRTLVTALAAAGVVGSMASAARAQATAPATWTEVPLLNRRAEARDGDARNQGRALRRRHDRRDRRHLGMGRRELDAQDARHQAVRRARGATMAAYGSKLVLFGGTRPSARHSTKRGSGTARTGRCGRPRTSPPARFGRGWSYVGSKLVLFGGDAEPRPALATPGSGTARTGRIGRPRASAPARRLASITGWRPRAGRPSCSAERDFQLQVRRHVGMERQRLDAAHAGASSAGASTGCR